MAMHVIAAPQTVDVDKFWDSMIAAILKADMLSPLNVSIRESLASLDPGPDVT